MEAEKAALKEIDEYIAGFPDGVREILEQVRATIRKAAPDAEEAIRYQIPTFTLNGNLVHFAGYKHHIGFYPGSEAIEKFSDKLSGYASAKGSVQFPLDQPMPLDLISKIVKFRVREQLEKAEAKRKKEVARPGPSAGEIAAVDRDVGAGDEGSGVGAQPDHQLGDLRCSR